jgi:hypothetical protein
MPVLIDRQTASAQRRTTWKSNYSSTVVEHRDSTHGERSALTLQMSGRRQSVTRWLFKERAWNRSIPVCGVVGRLRRASSRTRGRKLADALGGSPGRSNMGCWEGPKCWARNALTSLPIVVLSAAALSFQCRSSAVDCGLDGELLPESVRQSTGRALTSAQSSASGEATQARALPSNCRYIGWLNVAAESPGWM